MGGWCPTAYYGIQRNRTMSGLLADANTPGYAPDNLAQQNSKSVERLSMSQNNRIDVERIRKDFPILGREVRPGVPLVYLDSTATSQKPVSVLRAMEDYYRRTNANIHRGIHTLAEESTALYEEARKKIAAFINTASSP